MAKATWAQTNFNGGEWSPLAWGRFDLAKYKNGLSECLNFVPTQQGGLTRRGGTRYAAKVKDSANPSRLQKFEFSVSQACILEFGGLYVRRHSQSGTSGPTMAPLHYDMFPSGHDFELGTMVTHDGLVYVLTALSYEYASPTNSTVWMATDYPSPWATFVEGQHYEAIALVTYNGVQYMSQCDNKVVVSPDITDTDCWYLLGENLTELPTPYTADEIWELDFAQSADTLYITHPNHAPRKLQRHSGTIWSLVEVDFLDGPYLPVNTSSTTLTPSASTGTVTVTASSTAGINDGAGFRDTDVGRALRIKCEGVWLWGNITAVDSTTSVQWCVATPTGSDVPYRASAIASVSGGSVFSITVTDGGSGYGATPPDVYFNGVGTGAVAYATVVDGSVASITVAVTGSGYYAEPTVGIGYPGTLDPSATYFWRLGVWNETDGYPRAVTFHQDRLVFCGAENSPGRADASNTGDYENFSPTNLDGTVVDSNAFAFTLNSGELNALRWVVSDEWGLALGTAGGEWIMSPSNTQQAVTPTNVNAKQVSNYGSCGTAPVRLGKAILFVQRTGRKIRELSYQYTYNTFLAPDISLVGEHLTKSGIKQMALQLAPQQIVWMARSDGRLVAMTYDKDQEVLGWHQHTLGGYSDAGQSVEPIVESVVCVPSPDIDRDVLWLAVSRYIDGETVCHIESVTKFWEDGDTLPYAVFLDSSAEYSGTATTTISGLTWLVGQTVGVLADGATHPDCVVAADGTISLSRSAEAVQVGLGYTSRAQTLGIEAGGSDGPSQGKLKRIYRAAIRFFQSVGLSVGTNIAGASSYPQLFRTSADLMDNPVGLFDGDKRWSYEGTWDLEGKLYVETSDPLPCNITLLMTQLETSDGQ